MQLQSVIRTAGSIAALILAFTPALAANTAAHRAAQVPSTAQHASVVHTKTHGSTAHTARHGSAHLAVAPEIYYGHTRQSGLMRAPSISPAITSDGASDYLSCSQGVCRWPSGHLINVYVAPGRPTFPNMVQNCFREWTNATRGRVHFRLVSSPAQADYVITWTRRQKEVSEGTEAGLTTTDTFIDETGREYIDRAHTSVLTRYDGRPLSDCDIAETCLHEIGHGLGIEGHSANPRDIMYYAVSDKQTGHLTARDANTIARLYCN